jgi:hypothetical protein
MKPFLFNKICAKQWQIVGCKAIRDHQTETVASLLHCSRYNSDTSVRLVLIETATGIAHTDLHGRSLLGIGQTDGKTFFQIAFLTIFF